MCMAELRFLTERLFCPGFPSPSVAFGKKLSSCRRHCPSSAAVAGTSPMSSQEHKDLRWLCAFPDGTHGALSCMGSSSPGMDELVSIMRKRKEQAPQG